MPPPPPPRHHAAPLASEMLTTWLSDSASCGTLRQRKKERQKKFLDAPPNSRPNVSGLKLSVFRFFLDGENVSNMERKGGGSFHSLVELNMEEGRKPKRREENGRRRSSHHQHLHGSLLKSWRQNLPIIYQLLCTDTSDSLRSATLLPYTSRTEGKGQS